MVPRLTLLILLVATSAARAGLDLLPTTVTESSEGGSTTHLAFHDDGTQITYYPPRGWTCAGSRDLASFSIPGYPTARAFISSAPKLRVPALDDKAEKLLMKNPGLLGLPKGATGIAITALTLNPLIIDSHPTLEIQMTYSFFGEKCERSLLLCDRKGAEVSFVFDCPAPDFPKLAPLFRRSLYLIDNL